MQIEVKRYKYKHQPHGVVYLAQIDGHVYFDVMLEYLGRAGHIRSATPMYKCEEKALEVANGLVALIWWSNWKVSGDACTPSKKLQLWVNSAVWYKHVLDDKQEELAEVISGKYIDSFIVDANWVPPQYSDDQWENEQFYPVHIVTY